jgi:hypothetical protein
MSLETTKKREKREDRMWGVSSAVDERAKPERQRTRDERERERD